MAIHNTLSSLFTDIATALRDRKETSATIVADNFPKQLFGVNPVIEVSTEADMDSKLVAANFGKYYKFVGTTTSKYTNGHIYTLESETDANYKSMLGATISGSNATGFYTYTGQTTTTYKYMNPSTLALAKSETITENNKLRYWLHIPYNYDPSQSYRLITYLDGSGGVMLIQSNENGGSGYNRLNLSYFAEDTATIPEIQNSYHLQLLSASGASGAGHTGYIDSVYNFENDTMEYNHVGTTNGDSEFLTNWLNYVKANPTYDAFLLVPQWNDELWFENRGKYTIDGVDCVQLDIHNSYTYGYGEQLSTKSYGKTYLVDQLSASPQLQLVTQVQDILMQKYSINSKQLTVMGFSLGGVGTYDFINHYPTRYATAIPCCAASCDLSTENLTRLVGTKIRNYYGTSDGWIGADAFGTALVSRFTALGGEAATVGVSSGHRPTAFTSDFDNVISFIYSNERA